MSKLLTKANFAIARLASKEEELPVHLRSIFVSPEEAKDTDGHCALIVTAEEVAA